MRKAPFALSACREIRPGETGHSPAAEAREDCVANPALGLIAAIDKLFGDGK
jgi:hypothetical protein